MDSDSANRLLSKCTATVLFCLAIFSLFAVPSVPAFAQRCGTGCGNPEAMLGLKEQTLIALYPDLRRPSKPIQGPGGTKGRWQITDIALGSQIYDGVVYFSGVTVTRVEFISTASEQDCRTRAVFSQTKDQLTQRYGESQASGTYEVGGKASYSVAFATDTADVLLHVIESQESCTTRVTFKQHEGRDATNL